MGTVELCSGDLFGSRAAALGHGINTQGVMGGIAAEFRARWPEMYDEYRARCRRSELSPGDVMAWHAPDLWIFNLVTQRTPGPDARTEWLRTSLEHALAIASREGLDRIAVPRIGCGTGGLRWRDVEPVFREAADSSSCGLEVWSL